MSIGCRAGRIHGSHTAESKECILYSAILVERLTRTHVIRYSIDSVRTPYLQGMDIA